MSDTPEEMVSNEAAPARAEDAARSDDPADDAAEDAARDVVEVPEAPEIEEPPFEPADETLRVGEGGPASEEPPAGQVEVLNAEEPEPELPSTIDAIGTGPTDRVRVQVEEEEPLPAPPGEDAPSDVTVEPPLEEAVEEPADRALQEATVRLDEPADLESAPPVEAPPAAPAPEAAEEEGAPAANDPFRGPGDWYVVHTYAGYENKVKANLESRIHTMQMEDKIFHVHIPMEDVMEIKGGKKQVVQRKVFPGYLLVKMIYDNDSWYVVRNTPGVTGFVAAGTGSKPTPLSRREVEKILAVKKEEVKPQFRLGFEEGDVVRIISGPFADFNGTISEINVDQSKLKVLVNIFDRETPVELGFDQVAKV
jgi:transcription termination/antitermination protein NusG